MFLKLEKYNPILCTAILEAYGNNPKVLIF
ncbi:Uncharacterised protein [Legionella pneumophila]|nr:Uncharacterised protein [Legionella pneumophila]CZH22764.1 Uncharacterised protein [Legionella pneumophila]CZH25855.1 Uncharacterised protein [Legionella pneumophila]CZH34557.1 Uncharacterised protein [Legionella pneumophila]CZH56416.1 Uncharacterised protein [Legionella pneumophila]